MDVSDPDDGELENSQPRRAKKEAFLKSIKLHKPQELPVKELMGLWGYQRRGRWITNVIEEELRDRGLATSPEISKADYYGNISVLDRRDLSETAELALGWPISSVVDIERKLIFAKPDDKLIAVKTLMLLHDISQVPVLDRGGRDLLGSITWRSLAQCEEPLDGAIARRAMETRNPVAHSDDDLLDHIGTIVRYEYLYIRDPKNVIVGILTATDLAESFHNAAGSFIKIGEIENRIRLIIDQLPLPVIEAARAPSSTRSVNSASDLSFGEYVRILENPELWSQLALPFDRALIVENLKSVNAIRNDVMHFRPGKLDVQMIEAIDRCLNWIRTINTK